MVAISKDVQVSISEKLSKQINKILNSPELKDLNDEQIEKLAKSVVIDNLKEQLKTEVKKSTINIEELKDKWLLTFNSDSTRINYKHNVEEFLNWLEKRSIIDLRAIDADDYLQFLKNSKLSSGSIRFRIAAASSFCNYLRRADILNQNYFLKIKGLPKTKEKLKIIPSDNDILIIEQELNNEIHSTGRGSAGKQRGAIIMIVALSLIKNHALRIGALESLSIDTKGLFIADSKTNTVRGKLNRECLELINEFKLYRNKPFEKIKTNSIKKQFERFLTRLCKEDKIDKVFSPHDFRHYAAVRFYTETLDIFATMKFLNHKNITTTQIYLKGLGALD